MGPDATALTVLARRAQQGDAEAHAALLRELYGVVRKQVWLTIGAGAVAEDAVQETMIALHRGLGAFRGEASPRTWAITIAMRTARRLRRREDRHRPSEIEVDAELGGLDLDPLGAAEAVLLRKALQRLAPKKRDAFVLMAILELTAAEAARALGTFENTAASRYRHARAELEAMLREPDR